MAWILKPPREETALVDAPMKLTSGMEKFSNLCNGSPLSHDDTLAVNVFYLAPNIYLADALNSWDTVVEGRETGRDRNYADAPPANEILPYMDRTSELGETLAPHLRGWIYAISRFRQSQ